MSKIEMNQKNILRMDVIKVTLYIYLQRHSFTQTSKTKHKEQTVRMLTKHKKRKVRIL